MSGKLNKKYGIQNAFIQLGSLMEREEMANPMSDTFLQVLDCVNDLLATPTLSRVFLKSICRGFICSIMKTTRCEVPLDIK